MRLSQDSNLPAFHTGGGCLFLYQLIIRGFLWVLQFPPLHHSISHQNKASIHVIPTLSNLIAVPSHQMAPDILHVISTRCVAHDLQTIALRPLQRMCWRQLTVQWGDCNKKNLELHLSMRSLSLQQRRTWWAPNDLQMTVLEPLEFMCWRQFTVQSGDCNKKISNCTFQCDHYRYNSDERDQRPMCSTWFANDCAQADRLVGLVVKAPASRVEGPGFKSRLPRDFFGVESYQWLKNWHSSGYPARRLHWDWSVRCQYTVTGWGRTLDLQLLSQCGSM